MPELQALQILQPDRHGRELEIHLTPAARPVVAERVALLHKHPPAWRPPPAHSVPGIPVPMPHVMAPAPMSEREQRQASARQRPERRERRQEKRDKVKAEPREPREPPNEAQVQHSKQNAFFDELPADELLDKELELRQILLDQMDIYFQKDPTGEGPALSMIASKVKVVIYHRNGEGDDGEVGGGDVIDVHDESMEAQGFFEGLPPDGFLSSEEELREAIMNFLDGWQESQPPTIKQLERTPQASQTCLENQSALEFWHTNRCRLSLLWLKLGISFPAQSLLNLRPWRSHVASKRSPWPALPGSLGQGNGPNQGPSEYPSQVSGSDQRIGCGPSSCSRDTGWRRPLYFACIRWAPCVAKRVAIERQVLLTLVFTNLLLFALNGVSVGPHLLQVVHPLLSFDPVRIEAVDTSGSVEIQGAYMADFEHGKGAKLKYPLGLAPSGTFNYLEQREEFNVLSVFKSPMAIIGLVSMGAMFFLPKLQSMVEEEKERQQQEIGGERAKED
eukprot:symbB.v1.2.028506.t1/scaffold3027.1/size65053/4